MARGFTPADRETVREMAESQPGVHNTTPSGPGILVIYRNDVTNHVLGYDRLTTKYGWYVATFDRNETAGDVATLMPITEVTEDYDDDE